MGSSKNSASSIPMNRLLEETPRLHRRSTSPSGWNLSVTTATGVTTTGNLESVAAGMSHSSNSSRPTGAGILGRTAAAAGTSFSRELSLRPPGTAKGSSDWYEMCTESLGFESLADKNDLRDFREVIEELSLSSSSSSSSRTTRKCGVMSEKANVKDFPPFISTLDSNGRPRFSYEKVIGSEGRLSLGVFERDGTAVADDTGSKDDENDREKNKNKKIKERGEISLGSGSLSF